MLSFWKPLLEFELLRQTRGTRANVIRCAAGGLAVICLLYAQFRYLPIFGGVLVGSGIEILRSLTVLNYVLTVIAAVGLFATSLTNEREAGTLPLLIVADVPLRPFVIGRWLQDLLPAAMIAMVQLPIWASAVFFGGATLRQVTAAVMLLGSMLVLTSLIGILISVVARSGRQAVAFALAAIIGLELSPEAVRVMQQWQTAGWIDFGWGLTAAELMAGLAASVSTFETLQTVLASSEFPPVTGVVASQWLLGLFVLFAAITCAPLLTSESRPVEERGNITGRASHAVRGDAIAWREFRFRIYGWRGLAIRLGVYLAAGVVTLVTVRFANAQPAMAWASVLAVMALIAVLDLVWLAAQMFGAEMRQRTLTTLTLTTAKPGSLYGRKLIGLMPAIVVATLVFLLAERLIPNTTKLWFEQSWPGLVFVAASLFVWLQLIVMFSLDFPLTSVFVASIGMVVAWLIAAIAGSVWLAVGTSGLGDQGLLVAMTYFLGLLGIAAYGGCLYRLKQVASN